MPLVAKGPQVAGTVQRQNKKSALSPYTRQHHDRRDTKPGWEQGVPSQGLESNPKAGM